MNEEVVKVLEMVKSGRITPEEGEKLMSAIGVGGESAPGKKRASMLRVRVDVHDPNKEDQAKVTINVPLSLAKKMSGLVKMVPKDTKNELEAQGINLDDINIKELIEMFEDGQITEELINVDTGDGEKGAKVRVYVD
jgi:hypothetical protein